jgi:hypothetical protein
VKILFRLLLFFSFFSSFAVINVPSADWGLQMSWFIGLIIFVLYPITKRFKFRLQINRNFRLVTGFFFITLLITLLSWACQATGIIVLKDIDSNLLSRSLPHTIYLTFDYLVYLFLVMYLQGQKYHDKEIRAFITHAFYFIILWGIYQWLTTYGILPYIKIFNNNYSTGFTYLRFAWEHRSSSVFPEPSEYAYFIAFMCPFVLCQWFKRKENPSPPFSKHLYLMITLWVIAVLTCKSMALFLMIPFIFLYVISCNRKITTKFLIESFVGIFIIAGIILFTQTSRIANLVAGDDGSALIRLTSFIESYQLFLDSPVIGAGFGSVRGLDLLGFILGTMGIVGLLVFLRLIFKLRADTPLNSVFIQGLKCVLIVAMISNPILDHLFFWVILAFITVPLTTKREYENRLHTGAL